MIHRRSLALSGLLAISLLVPCLSGRAAQEQKPEPKPEPKQEQEQKPKKKPKAPRVTRVLFLGGSASYYNNLPDIFAKLALAAGAGPVETGVVATAGWGLKDHWQKGDAHRVLREKNWKFVVLEDGSLVGATAAADSGEGAFAAFRPFARNWAELVQDVRAVPVFFLNWPSREAPGAQPRLNAAYFGIAKEAEARVAGIGLAWDRVPEELPGLDLYAADGVNPSPAGTYLAACTLYAAIFGKSPEGAPAKLGGRPFDNAAGKVTSESVQILIDLPPEQARALQRAAWEVKKLLDKNKGYLPVPEAPER